MAEPWTERCRDCEGLGVVPTSSSTLYPEMRPCSRCDGRGQITYREVDLADLERRAAERGGGVEAE